MDVKKKLDEWWVLVCDQHEITKRMERKLKSLVGKKTRFAHKYNMRPAPCEILDTKHDGEGIKIRNLRTGKVYWIYARDLKPKVKAKP